MYFAQSVDISNNLVAQYGALGLIITGLIVALVYYVRKSDFLQKTINELQEIRITEAKEVNEKLTAPMHEQQELSKKIYDVLLNINNKRGQ